MHSKQEAYQNWKPIVQLIYEDWPANSVVKYFLRPYSHIEGVSTTTLTLISVKDTLDETSGKILRILCSLKTQERFQADPHCCFQHPHLIYRRQADA